MSDRALDSSDDPEPQVRFWIDSSFCRLYSSYNQDCVRVWSPNSNSLSQWPQRELRDALIVVFQACVLSVCCAHNCVPPPLPPRTLPPPSSPQGWKLTQNRNKSLFCWIVFGRVGVVDTHWEDFRSIQCCGQETRSWGQVCFENQRSHGVQHRVTFHHLSYKVATQVIFTESDT